MHVVDVLLVVGALTFRLLETLFGFHPDTTLFVNRVRQNLREGAVRRRRRHF